MATTPKGTRHQLDIAARISAFADGDRISRGISFVGVTGWGDTTVEMRELPFLFGRGAVELCPLRNLSDCSYRLHVPLAMKLGKARLADEKLLCRGLFDVA